MSRFAITRLAVATTHPRRCQRQAAIVDKQFQALVWSAELELVPRMFRSARKAEHTGQNPGLVLVKATYLFLPLTRG